MSRRHRDLAVCQVAVLIAFALAVACSDGSGPDNGSTTGSIGGMVTSEASGVAGAEIALTGAASGNRTTASDGAYLFDDLGAGSYTVTITLPSGFALAAGETATKPATVTAGQTTTVNWSALQEAENVTIVTASGTSFSPSAVTVPVGRTVRWVVNNGSHTVTPDNPGQPGVWPGTGLLNPGQQFEHTFTTPGVYEYHCIPHESLGMTGTITVQ